MDLERSDRRADPLSWGYRLPRRGDSGDNANNDDYSRLTDGDPASFWKSNPYLDPDALKDGEPHLQWLMVEFDKPHLVNAAVIDWATPYATRYQVQYSTSFDKFDRPLVGSPSLRGRRNGAKAGARFCP